MKRIISIFALLAILSTSCLGIPGYNAVDVLPTTNSTLNLGSPTQYYNAAYINHLYAGSISGNGTHTQNTDWILTTNGVTPLINSGNLTSDLRTDRWLKNDTNTFIGVSVAGLGSLLHTALQEGWYNTYYGNNAGRNTTTGYKNTYIGESAGYRTTTGFYNTFIGADSGSFTSTGQYNTTLGYQSFALNTLGSYNTAIGLGALGLMDSGDYNTAVGMQSLSTNTAGSRNTALGVWAGKTNTGSYNVFLGKSAGENSGSESHMLYIDNTSTATPLISGNFTSNRVTIYGDFDLTDNVGGDSTITTNKTSARDLTIVTGTEKTIYLDTPVYDDLQVNMSNAKTPAVNAPAWVSYKNSEVPSFSKTATNILYFAAQLPHSYKEGTNIEYHIHISYPDNGVGNSVWYFTYSWANIDGTFPAASNSGNVVVPSHTTADFHDMAQIITTISGAGKTVSSILLCSISRLGGDGSDSYDNVIYLLTSDFHYQKDTIGSRTQLTK